MSAAFAQDWEAWRASRWETVSAPHGLAALADTVWLGEQPQRIHGLAGTWRADDGAAVLEGVAGDEYRDGAGRPLEDGARLVPGEEVAAGDVLVRIFERDGVLAVRRIDPEADSRTTLRGIDAFEPDPAWSVPARFEPSGAPLEVESVDGHRSVAARPGLLHLVVDGQERTLTATAGPEALSVVFADADAGRGTYRFRFLRVPLPDADGRTTVDFNRAFLPPCAFSDHYVCPLPQPGNRWDIPVPVGERIPVRAS